MRIQRAILVALLVLFSSVCIAAKLSPQQLQAIYSNTVDAYIYGYPLVIMDTTKKVMTNVPNPTIYYGRAPINQFSHVPVFPSPTLHDVVSPNADTLYSMAWLDLSKEPIVLHVPATGCRYYLLQMLDAWTNVFTSVGKRTTGTQAGDFIIIGPNWQGKFPANVIGIRSPTNMAWIIGRTQTNGPADYAAVHAIQQQYTLTPLSAWERNYSPSNSVAINSQINMNISPAQQVVNMDAATFFSTLAKLLSNNPPTPADAPMLTKLASLGIMPGQAFDLAKQDPEYIQTMNRAVKAAQEQIATQGLQFSRVENGWRLPPANIGDYGTNYLERAAVAMAGLGANLASDAIYPFAMTDNEGKPLNGTHRYVIHFSKNQIPPVNAFWSITLYDQKHFFVANPINRYAIGDRDKLQFNKDGSLDIYLQHTAPSKDKESNWLPAPQEDFNLIMRLYWPSAAVLNGTWKPPFIRLIQ